MDHLQPSHAASNVSNVLLRGLPAAIVVASALAMQPVAAQGAAHTGGTPTTPALGLYLDDLHAAVRLSGPATALRARDVADATLELALVRSGLSATGTFVPNAEFERDLDSGSGAWDIDVDLDLTGSYRFDRERILRARIALERAAGRLRAQRRSDAERAMLALSDSRLGARALEDARLAVAETAAALAAAPTGDNGELESLQIAAELAVVELERELHEHRDADSALAELGLSDRRLGVPTGPTSFTTSDDVAWLEAAPAPQLKYAESGPRTTPASRLLALELELAQHTLNLAPFEFAREIEVFSGYEASGIEAGARVALEVGVPTAEASFGWQPGEDDNVFTIGFGASFRLSDTSSDETRVAHRDVADARDALAAFSAAWPANERDQRTLAELAYREFVLELRAQDLSVAQLEELEGAGVDGSDLARARTAVRRARDASERAWQRYVRALGDYLDVVDVVLSTD